MMMGLEKITERILGDANAQASEILAKADATRDALLDDARRQAKEIHDAAEKQTAEEEKNILFRAQSSVEGMRRGAIEEARSQLLDEVYAKTLTEVKNFSVDMTTKLLLNQLIDVLKEQEKIEKDSVTLYGEEGAFAPEHYEVLLGEHDLISCLPTLRTLFPDRAEQAGLDKSIIDRLVWSDTPAKIDGGLILRTGEIEINCSLQEMFRELRVSTEEKVLKTLFP